MVNQQVRYEDYGDGKLYVSEEDGGIKIYTMPTVGQLIFANYAWAGQSPHTFEFLQISLLKALRTDNEEMPLPSCIHRYSSESRPGDNYPDWPWKHGHIVVWDHWEVTVSILIDEGDKPIIFKSPENWWKSKHTYEAAKQLIEAMKRDNENEETSQKYREKNT